jgi:probable rRNA maturation factor
MAAAVADPTYPRASKRRRMPDPGVLEIFVADEQDQEPVDTARWRALAEQVLTAEGIQGEAELSVIFIEEAAMTELNQRFMGESGPTDVLSFPIDDDLASAGRYPDNGTPGPISDRDEPTDPPLMLGDVVICPAVAARNAPGHAGTYDDELALLVVHGILHVLGHDHAEAEETEEMQAKERDLLARFHAKPASPEGEPAPDQPTSPPSDGTTGPSAPEQPASTPGDVAADTVEHPESSTGGGPAPS